MKFPDEFDKYFMQRAAKYYELVKSWFWALPLWKRTILTSLIGAIGGSSIIGFINQFALFCFAFNQGIRVPVEGVEYLGLAVTLVSFVIITVSIIGTVLIYSILDFVAESVLKLLSVKEVAFINIKTILVLLQLVILSVLMVKNVLERYYSAEGPGKLELLPLVFWVSILGLIIMFMLGLIFSKSRQWRKVFTLVIVLVGVSGVALSLFNQSVYKYFLQSIRYGGEIPVTIEYRQADNTKAQTSGDLLIRTKESIILKNMTTRFVEEIPNSRVSRIIFIDEVKN